MEIVRWVYCAVVSCALLSCIVGKTVSLNDLIESESNQIQSPVHTTTSPKIEDLEPAAVRFSLNKGLKPFNRLSKKYKETGKKLNLRPLGKRISPLQYRKTFQIRSPLKPKRVKHSIRTRHKRKNQSVKREINGHELLNQKYIPLLKSLGMLFDNILGADSSESFEETKNNRKRLRYILEGDADKSCACPRQAKPDTDSFSQEEAITTTTTVTSEVEVTTETTSTTTHHSSVSDLSGFRHHQIVPLLLSRNTTSARRNHHGVSERSRTAHNGSAERYIPGDHGDSKYDTEWGQEQSNAKSYEDYTDSDPRNYASSTGTRGTVRNRELRSDTEEVNKNYTTNEENKTKKLLEDGKYTIRLNAAHKLKTKRDKTKSGKLLSEPIRRKSGFVPYYNVIDSAESIQPEDNYKEGIINVTFNGSGDQRLFDKNGSHSSEDQEVNAGIETVTEAAVIKTFELYTESSRIMEIQSKISKSAESIEEQQYEKNINADIIYDSEDKLPNIVSSKPEDLLMKSKSEATISKEEPVEHIENTKISEIKAILSRETDESDEGKASIEYGRYQEPFSYEDSRMQALGRISNTVELKPPKVEIPAFASTVSRSSRSKGPMVMIIDGYSVTRHKNGENKLAEKAIRIRP